MDKDTKEFQSIMIALNRTRNYLLLICTFAILFIAYQVLNIASSM
jgi:type IV secretory pathway component VirB8